MTASQFARGWGPSYLASREESDTEVVQSTDLPECDILVLD